MTTNPYFQKDVQSEQELMDSLIIETIQIHGSDFLYIPRETVTRDQLFGEEVSRFTDVNRIEMYFEGLGLGFDPTPPSTGDMMSRFGLEVPDAGNFIVSRRRFLEVMSHNVNIRNLGRPREGDLVYYPIADALFEIKFVEDEVPFYTFGAKYTFNLNCQRFTYNQEVVDTGDSSVDDLAKEVSNYLKVLTLGATAGVGINYTVGERVFSGTSADPTADGKSTAWSLVGKILTVNVAGGGEFVVGGIVEGETSGTRYVISSIADSDTRTGADSASDNAELDLETNRDDIFDFSEKDPFSTGLY